VRSGITVVYGDKITRLRHVLPDTGSLIFCLLHLIWWAICNLMSSWL